MFRQSGLYRSDALRTMGWIAIARLLLSGSEICGSGRIY
jgi:hypothetical protein